MEKLLKKSLDEAIPVEIIYQNKNNVFSKRIIQVRTMNETYIKAYCQVKKQVRIFRRDSIFAAQLVKMREEQLYA